jgi:hypothetical protein
MGLAVFSELAPALSRHEPHSQPAVGACDDDGRYGRSRAEDEGRPRPTEVATEDAIGPPAEVLLAARLPDRARVRRGALQGSISRKLVLPSAGSGFSKRLWAWASPWMSTARSGSNVAARSAA